MEPSEVIQRAAQAGRDAVKVYDESPGSLRMALAALADAGAAAAMRSLLTELREMCTEIWDGDEAIGSAVDRFKIDKLLAELPAGGDTE